MTLFTALGVVAVMALAFILICVATVATFRFVAHMAGRCAHSTRVAYAAGALASFAGIFIVGAAGIWGASALLGLAN